MSNFIEVTIIRDTHVLDGIIHGAYHRNKEAMEDARDSHKRGDISGSEAAKDTLNQNVFGYIDVTRKAADASLYSILRRDDIGFITDGIHMMGNQFRGRTLNSPSIIFSDNLEVISKEELTEGLRTTLSTLFSAGRTKGNPIRFYCSANFSEKFSECVSEALFRYLCDGTVGRERMMPYIEDRPMNISPEDIHNTFLEGRAPSRDLDNAKFLVLSNTHSHLYDDLLIDKIWSFCVTRNMDLYVPMNRFRNYVLGRAIHIGEIA